MKGMISQFLDELLNRKSMGFPRLSNTKKFQELVEQMLKRTLNRTTKFQRIP
jgi:hypothetical protein